MITWLTNPTKKIESYFKDKTLIFSNWKNLKSIHGSGKNLSKLKIQKESKDDINKNIRNLFKLKKKRITRWYNWKHEKCFQTKNGK